MNKKLIIYGNGNMAKMVYHFVKNDHEVVGFTVDEQCIVEKTIENLPLIAFDRVEDVFHPCNHYLLIAVGFVQMNNIRELKYKEGKGKGYKFINYIHSSVVRHSNVKFGENNIILDYVSIHPYTTIGNSNFISSNTNVGHGCKIKDNCWINAGVSIAGETTIKDNCFLGINSSVGHELIIAEKTFVSANSTVNKHTESGGVYLTPAGEKFRLKSESFLKFVNGI